LRRWTVAVAASVGVIAGLTLVLLMCAGRLGPSAEAATNCTFSTGSDWNTAADWDCGHVPTSADVAVIDGTSVEVAASPPPVGGIRIVNAGEIVFSAPSAVLSDAGDLVVANGDVTQPGTLIVAGNLLRTAADNQFAIEGTDLELDGPANVLDNGELCVQGGSLTLNGLLTIEDGSNATPFNCVSGMLVIGVHGELRSARTTPTVIDTPITNNGAVTDASSTLTLFGSGTSSGTLQALDNAASPTRLQLGKTWTVSGTVSAVGSAVLATAGDVTSLSPAATLDVSALDLVSPLVLQGSSTQALPRLTFSGGTLTSTRPVTATNLVVGFGTLAGNFTLTVPADGSFTRSGTNTDTFAINSGVTLSLDEPTSTPLGGRLSVASGATLNASQLAFSGGGITVDGNLTAPLSLTNGAFLAGSGTTVGVTNTSGFVRPGDPDGTLTVTGNYTQGASGEVDIAISGTSPGSFGVLAVTGAASVAGRVATMPTSDFIAHDGNTFDFLTAASRSGTFATTVDGTLGYFLTYPSSAPLGAVLNWESAPNGTATVTGPDRVGLVDTCVPNFVRATSYSYQWYVNGAVASGLRSQSIRISEIYYLKSMGCVAVARGPGGVAQYQTGWHVIHVGPALALKSRPYLFRKTSTGTNRTTAKPGVREYANRGVWAPAGVTYTYQWYRGTTKISRAIGRYYVPRSSDVGHRISCVVTAHRRGWTNALKRTVALPVRR